MKRLQYGGIVYQVAKCCECDAEDQPLVEGSCPRCVERRAQAMMVKAANARRAKLGGKYLEDTLV